MAKSKVQFQQGYSFFDFVNDYGTEEKCEQALFHWRFPKGYICRACGNTTYCKLKCRNLLQCNHCRHQHSLTSGTLFASTKIPLTKWFMAIHLLTQSKTGLSAMALKRQLGVSYNTAWKVKHKLLQVMKETEDSRVLEGIIQVDDAYWGGERRGGKRGRGAAGKTPFVAAVACNEEHHPIAMKMTVVKGFTSEAISTWATQHLAAGSISISDGLACFKAINDGSRVQLGAFTTGRLELMEHPAFKWVNIMLGNLKNSLRGSCHSVSARHLPRHLAEYCFRFNNRFDLRELMPKLLRAAVSAAPMPYRLLKLAEPCG